MYLRRCYRRKDGKRHAYWALVESYRTSRGPRQRVVAWLGVMDERGRLGVKRCAERRPGYQTGLFFHPFWFRGAEKAGLITRAPLGAALHSQTAPLLHHSPPPYKTLPRAASR